MKIEAIPPVREHDAVAAPAAHRDVAEAAAVLSGSSRVGPQLQALELYRIRHLTGFDGQVGAVVDVRLHHVDPVLGRAAAHAAGEGHADEAHKLLARRAVPPAD